MPAAEEGPIPGLTVDERRRIGEIIDSFDWDFFERWLFVLERGVRLLSEATSDYLWLWDERLEPRYPNEFKVPREDIAEFTSDELLAYLAKLVATTVNQGYGPNHGEPVYRPDGLRHLLTPSDLLCTFVDIWWGL